MIQRFNDSMGEREIKHIKIKASDPRRRDVADIFLSAGNVITSFSLCFSLHAGLQYLTLNTIVFTPPTALTSPYPHPHPHPRLNSPHRLTFTRPLFTYLILCTWPTFLFNLVFAHALPLTQQTQTPVEGRGNN